MDKQADLKRSDFVTDNRNPSATKRGPGRFHQEGHRKTPPIKNVGASFGFVQRIDSVRNAIRKEKRVIGRRQWLIMRKSDRATARLAQVMPEAFQQDPS